jgi:uncharacterized phage protein (TIGR01671 family)
MREIKFRAKEMGLHWVYGDLVRDGNFDSTLIRCKNGIYANVDYTTVGQFTGLYDKHGEEIYEGDIIRSFNSHGNSIYHHIEYREASFVAILMKTNRFAIDIESTLTQDWLNEFDKVIIGNIHDDKDYLIK